MKTKKAQPKKQGTVQRPDLAEVHGTGKNEETHRPGEHKEGDAPGGAYSGAHGGTLPRSAPKSKPKAREAKR